MRKYLPFPALIVIGTSLHSGRSAADYRHIKLAQLHNDDRSRDLRRHGRSSAARSALRCRNPNHRPVALPKGAPNILLIVTFDQGYEVSVTSADHAVIQKALTKAHD
jgi:hypothetical protein